MKKTLLTERYQQLAGIKPLYTEQSDSKEDQLKMAYAAYDKAEMNGDIRGQELALAVIDSIKDKEEAESMSNASIKALQVAISDYSLNTILTRLAAIVDQTGKHDEADMIKNLASKINEFELDEQNTTGTGASFSAGNSPAYATPKAFGKKRDKDIEVLGYKKVNEQQDELSKDAQTLSDHPLLDKINTKDEWVDIMNSLMMHANSISQVTDSIKKTTLLDMIKTVGKK